MTVAQKEKVMNLDELLKEIDALNPLVQESLTTEQHRIRVARKKSDLANFSEGDYDLVAR